LLHSGKKIGAKSAGEMRTLECDLTVDKKRPVSTINSPRTDPRRVIAQNDATDVS